MAGLSKDPAAGWLAGCGLVFLLGVVLPIWLFCGGGWSWITKAIESLK